MTALPTSCLLSTPSPALLGFLALLIVGLVFDRPARRGGMPELPDDRDERNDP